MMCYQNSLLQTLYVKTGFCNALYKWKFDDGIPGEERRGIPFQLQKVFTNLQTCKWHAVELTDVMKSVGWDSSTTGRCCVALCSTSWNRNSTTRTRRIWSSSTYLDDQALWHKSGVIQRQGDATGICHTKKPEWSEPIPDEHFLIGTSIGYCCFGRSLYDGNAVGLCSSKLEYHLHFVS